MQQPSLFESTVPFSVPLEERVLEFHKTHDVSKGEFYNTTLDLDLPIKTSYFAKTTEGLGICRFAPTWFYGSVWTALAPSKELLKAYKSNKITRVEYCKIFYQETLSQLDAEKVYKELERRGFPTLLCFEKQGAFCHRHLVQEWLFLELFANNAKRNNKSQISKDA